MNEQRDTAYNHRKRTSNDVKQISDVVRRSSAWLSDALMQQGIPKTTIDSSDTTVITRELALACDREPVGWC